MRTSIWELVTYTDLLRSAYAALAAGDRDGYLAHCARGMDRTAAPADDGVRYVVRDIYTNGDGGIVRVHCMRAGAGRIQAYDAMHLYEIRGGELASFREIRTGRVTAARSRPCRAAR